MNGNIFDKVDRQGEKINKIEEGQQEILEMLQKMQQGANASSQGAQNGANPYQAQMQRVNQQATIRNFMMRAVKCYRYMTDWKTFEAEKKLPLLLALILFGLGIVMIPVVSIAAGLYTTFTFVENIWLVFVLIVLFQIKRAKPLYECFEFSEHCFMKFAMDGDGTMRKGLFMKKRYRVFQVLACISAVCNIICVWMEGKVALAIFATLFEIAFFVLTILVLYKADDFFMMYGAIYYTADNDKGTQRVTIVYNELDQKLYTKDDFEKRFIPTR